MKSVSPRADCDVPCFEQLKATHLIRAPPRQQALLYVLLQLIKRWPLIIGPCVSRAKLHIQSNVQTLTLIQIFISFAAILPMKQWIQFLSSIFKCSMWSIPLFQLFIHHLLIRRQGRLVYLHNHNLFRNIYTNQVSSPNHLE